MDEIIKIVDHDSLIAGVVALFFLIGVIEYARDRVKERNLWKDIGK